MKRKGWTGESTRHSLSARKVKTGKYSKLSAAYRKAYDDWYREYKKPVDRIYEQQKAKHSMSPEQKNIYKALGLKYKEQIKKQPWFKSKTIYAIGIDVIPNKEYELLPEERRLESRGEMSYAMTTLGDNDERERIIIRDSGNGALNRKLLKHELEEYKIYRKLLESGTPQSKAAGLAHELTLTKVSNSEVDKAYGNIGDPT